MNTICNTDNTTFGAWLSSELDRRGLSQSDLARACKITCAHISRIISGKGNAGVKSLVSIARAFNLSVDDVFEKAGLPSPNGLSSTKRTLVDLIKQLPDSDVEALITLVEPPGI